MTYKVVKLRNDVLVYDVDTPDDKMEFMDNIDAKPGDVFRFTYNGWLVYLGNNFYNAQNPHNEDSFAVELRQQINVVQL